MEALRRARFGPSPRPLQVQRLEAQLGMFVEVSLHRRDG